jgi:CBS domain-containing protein
MSRHRGDWDEDFDGGGPRRREGDARDARPGGWRDAGRGYGDVERGAARGDYYRDEYYAGGRPRARDFRDEHPDERARPREFYPPPPPPPESRYARPRDDYRRARGATRSHLRCRDIMTRDVTVASRATTLEEVARMMRDEDTGVIPVVEPGETPSDSVTEVHKVPARAVSNGKLVGLITDRDIVVRALAEGRDAREVRAEEVMTTDIHAARPNDRVIEAIRLMGDRQVRRLPVVDREGNLRGIISMADIALETEADRELGEALEEISSGASFWNRIFS